jgi:hypothetical protein
MISQFFVEQTYTVMYGFRAAGVGHFKRKATNETSVRVWELIARMGTSVAIDRLRN